MNFQNFLRTRKGSVTTPSLRSWQTGLCLPGGSHDIAAIRAVVRNCRFLSLAEAERCWVPEGYSPGGELDCAHSSAPSSLWDTVISAGFVIGTGRHPGVEVQAHPGSPERAAMKSAAVALPLPWEGVSAGYLNCHGTQCSLQPSIQPHGSLSRAPHGSLSQAAHGPCPALHPHLPGCKQVFQAKLPACITPCPWPQP